MCFTNAKWHSVLAGNNSTAFMKAELSLAKGLVMIVLVKQGLGVHQEPISVAIFPS